jgi:hypothetical protein
MTHYPSNWKPWWTPENFLTNVTILDELWRIIMSFNCSQTRTMTFLFGWQVTLYGIIWSNRIKWYSLECRMVHRRLWSKSCMKLTQRMSICFNPSWRQLYEQSEPFRILNLLLFVSCSITLFQCRNMNGICLFMIMLCVCTINQYSVNWWMEMNRNGSISSFDTGAILEVSDHSRSFVIIWDNSFLNLSTCENHVCHQMHLNWIQINMTCFRQKYNRVSYVTIFLQCNLLINCFIWWHWLVWLPNAFDESW